MPWLRTAFTGLCAAAIVGYQLLRKDTTAVIKKIDEPIIEAVATQEQQLNAQVMGSESIMWRILAYIYPFIIEILTEAECVVILSQLSLPFIVNLTRRIGQTLIGVDVIEKLATVHYTVGKRTERLSRMAAYPFEAAFDWACNSDLSQGMPSVPSNGFTTNCVGAYIAWLLEQIEIHKATIAAKDRALELEKAGDSAIQALIADISDRFDGTAAELTAAKDKLARQDDTIARQDEAAEQQDEQMAKMYVKYNAVQKRIEQLEVQLESSKEQNNLALKLREQRLGQQEERTKRELNAQKAKMRASDRDAKIWKAQAQSLQVGAENGVIAQDQLQKERDAREKEQEEAKFAKAEYEKAQGEASEALESANLATTEQEKAKNDALEELSDILSSKQELQESLDRLQQDTEKVKNDVESRESSLKSNYQEQIDKLTKEALQYKQERKSLFTRSDMDLQCKAETQRLWDLKRDELEQIFRRDVEAEAEKVTKESKDKLDNLQADHDELIASSGQLQIERDEVEAANKKLKSKNKKLNDDMSSLTGQAREKVEQLEQEAKTKQQEVLGLEKRLATLEEAAKYTTSHSEAKEWCDKEVQRRENEFRSKLANQFDAEVQKKAEAESAAARAATRKDFDEEVQKRVDANVDSETTRLQASFQSAVNEKLQLQRSELEAHQDKKIESEKKQAERAEAEIKRLQSEATRSTTAPNPAKSPSSDMELDRERRWGRVKQLLLEMAMSGLDRSKNEPSVVQEEADAAQIGLNGLLEANNAIEWVKLALLQSPLTTSKSDMLRKLTENRMQSFEIDDMIRYGGDREVLIKQAQAAVQLIDSLKVALDQSDHVARDELLALILAPRGDEDIDDESDVDDVDDDSSEQAATTDHETGQETFQEPEPTTQTPTSYMPTSSAAYTTITLPGLLPTSGSQPWESSGLSPSQGRGKAADNGFVLPRTGLLESGELLEPKHQPIDNPDTLAEFGDLYSAPSSFNGVRPIAIPRSRRNGGGRGPRSSLNSTPFQLPPQQARTIAIDPALAGMFPVVLSGRPLGLNTQPPNPEQEQKKPEGEQCESIKSSEEEDQPLSRLERLVRRSEKRVAPAAGPYEQPEGVVEREDRDRYGHEAEELDVHDYVDDDELLNDDDEDDIDWEYALEKSRFQDSLFESNDEDENDSIIPPLNPIITNPNRRKKIHKLKVHKLKVHHLKVHHLKVHHLKVHHLKKILPRGRAWAN
ncbi:hypothetical protein P7C71_g4817, partial [Lecanoromycetidae sp. Uapishka_2]